MTVRIKANGAPSDAIKKVVPTLVTDLVASRIADFDDSLWGPDAATEAAKRLGWTEAVSVSRPMVSEILELRDLLHGDGVNHIVLAGMGGSSVKLGVGQ